MSKDCTQISDPSQVAPANPAPRKEQTWQKPGERVAQGTPADEQSGETSHVANPAQGVSEAKLPATKTYVDRLIRIFRDRPADDTSAVVLIDYARAALTAAIGAGGQAVAWRVRPMPGFAWAYIEGDPDHNPAIRDYERQPLYTHPAPSGQAVAELHGPYGWLNGCRGLSEDSWTLESDPLENSAEYFAVPLYALVDPFKEIGKDFDGKPVLAHPSPTLPLRDEVELVLELAEPHLVAASADRIAGADKSLSALRALLDRLRAGAQEKAGFCSDCECVGPITNGRCHCGSGRIAAAPSLAKEGGR